MLLTAQQEGQVTRLSRSYDYLDRVEKRKTEIPFDSRHRVSGASAANSENRFTALQGGRSGEIEIQPQLFQQVRFQPPSSSDIPDERILEEEKHVSSKQLGHHDEIYAAGAESPLSLEVSTETTSWRLPDWPSASAWAIMLPGYSRFDAAQCPSQVEYKYRASLSGSPVLPVWLHYKFSERYKTGFLLGSVPFEGITEVDVVMVKVDTYEVEQFSVNITSSEREGGPGQNQVELVLDNLDLEDFFNQRRIAKLKGIFSDTLWPESSSDLHMSLLLPAKRPASNPKEKRGVRLRLASHAPFSEKLINLGKEVEPLYKHRPCPRNFKRSTAERFFRDQNFAVDWCSFELLSGDPSKSAWNVYEEEEYRTPKKRHHPLLPRPPYKPVSRSEVPIRDYLGDAVFTVMIPLVVMVALVFILTLIMCVQWKKKDEKENISDIQMMHYQAVRRASDSLRSLSRRRDRDSMLGPPSREGSSPPHSISIRSHTNSPASTITRNATPCRRSEERSSSYSQGPYPICAQTNKNNMSNIYIQEPPTSGKVLLKTTVGDIDVELWSKETPKACRNFIQLCMEGYYDGTIFHRVVKDFIVQGGDPTGTGKGGESIYGKPFKDEIHTRLRFVRRGLVAMANGGKDDNGSQFFFTLGPCPELQKKHTLFGKVTGDTIYNMIKLEEVDIDRDDRPVHPHKIIRTEILNNPFPDIVPRTTKEKRKHGSEEEEGSDDEKPKKRNKKKGTKNFKLLSFGDEAEEDEEESVAVSKKLALKSKSSHDLTNDPKLSSVPAVDVPSKRGPSEELQSSEEDDEPLPTEQDSGMLDRVRKKLKGEPKEEPLSTFMSERTAERDQSLKKLKAEVRQLKKELKMVKDDTVESTVDTAEGQDEMSKDSDILVAYKKDLARFENKRTKELKKGGREAATLALLARFQEKLTSVRQLEEEEEEEGESKVNVKKEERMEDGEVEEEEEDDENDSSWLKHTLKFESNDPVLARDASTKDDDWFDIYDPRNPITKRRREASEQALKQKGGELALKQRDKR
ncbi:unnamed protein product [Darwinula stevensoni]|uniref:Spliceosome-associated protein CWC27 homolog n=1 Tax=Darwinula stevensoni TaxID=69355 RepID=A0A7R9A948_9CRUS|nr:unnamed protein product [Darwinula stevensoni]CAG0897062.1 unnamed protein product [Darwinula stevensoni]